MKTAVSIPDRIFKAADELAHQLGMSRSSFYTTALRAYLLQHHEAAITARLDEVLSRENSALDASLQSVQTRSIDSGSWK